ncbi:MAG TPA: RtcB family protein [Thermoanaerobaculia bacterium]|nr:RtcB family protein [Thermoanaerobaculia bacterium]
MTLDPRLRRLDPNRLRVDNKYDLDAVLFANDQVPVEASAVTELLELLELQDTVEQVARAAPDRFEEAPVVEQVAVTPDFHKARGVPVGTVLATRGFVVPQAIGNDINCGMRLHTTSLLAEEVAGRLDELETAFRPIFFEGGRDIPMSRGQREALFRNGLTGLFDATPRTQTEGLWSLVHELDLDRELSRVERRGSLPAERVFGLDDFLGPAGRLSRDCQIGSIGGGNHFVEIQRIEKVFDGAVAHAWGLKPGHVTVMVHTGSVSVGHVCGQYFQEVVRRLHPAGLKHPGNGIFILPGGGARREEAALFWDALHNAANFAFANRMFLAMMAWAGLRRVIGEVDLSLLYDAPHNLMWREEQPDGREVVIHRKGACPARGFSEMAGTPFAYQGEPVLVPGSMGASSYILVGQGHAGSLCSASHGAGRSLSRGEALKGHDEELRRFLESFRVVTPVDLRRPDVRRRRDIVDRKLEEIKQEAPYAYKDIGPIIQTLTDAGIARPVAEVRPLMTIKG